MATGKLSIFVGCMFAGKTTALLKRVAEAERAGEKVRLYKPRFDTRHDDALVHTHDGVKAPAQWVGPDWGAPFANGSTVVALDEVQFFPHEIVPEITRALRRGVHVLAAGLDLTSQEEPFGPVPTLLALADEVVKLQASCSCCGRAATRSYRRAASNATILVGGSESYEPRCLSCYTFGSV
jgi:thymidine kinase